MNRQCGPDKAAQEYLSTFRCILNQMIQSMTRAKLTDSISHNFIVQMIPHHRGAIQMSKNILKYTRNEELCKIASQIITEQTKSIENMCSILGGCEKRINVCSDLNAYQCGTNAIMQTMFCRMRCACAGSRTDCDFMWEMIPHHRGAVEMAENTLRFDICPELKPILNAIITSQERGIVQMEELLRSLKC